LCSLPCVLHIRQSRPPWFYHCNTWFLKLWVWPSPQGVAELSRII
jgi:hypothetical protein